jgi:hypothetical protein
MGRRIIAACFLVSLFAYLLAVALTPTPILEVRAAEGDALLFCSAIASGDDVLYLSINSIYNVPVQERWRAQTDGTLAVVEVVSTPAVIGYYGIESYVPMADGQVRAIPNAARYHEILLKVGPRGQQRLVVRGQKVALYDSVPDATALIVAVRQMPRVVACR